MDTPHTERPRRAPGHVRRPKGRDDPRLLPIDTIRQRNKARAVELRCRCWTQEEIAAELGVGRSTVSRWLAEAAAADQARIEAAAPTLRAIEDQRYDWLGRRLMQLVDEEHDVQAAAVLVRLHDRRAKLHGLDIEPAPALGTSPIQRDYFLHDGPAVIESGELPIATVSEVAVAGDVTQGSQGGDAE